VPDAGLPARGLLGRHLAELSDPEDLPRLRAEMDALAQGGLDVQFEKRWLRKDGSRMRTLERVSTLRDAQGRPSSLLWLSFDLADGRSGQDGGRAQ